MGKLIIHKVIEQKIFVIRGKKVIVDRDLAELYGVETKHLNRQVRRNIDRFPEEFMFQLTENEKKELVTNWHQFKPLKHSYVLPYAFTEHGVTMAAMVLNSDTAIRVSVFIVKTFIKLREIIATQKELMTKFGELELRVDKHDKDILNLIRVIKELLEPKFEEKPRRKIGFYP